MAEPGRFRDRLLTLEFGMAGAGEESRVSFASCAEVGGLDAAARELRETVELPLKRPEVLRRLGVPPHRGALLYGPPGCGKTLLALAHESGAAFLPVGGPELITTWRGESEEKLRGLFAQAREAAYACLRRSLDLDAALASPQALDPNTLDGLEVTAQDLARGLAAARARTQAVA